MKLIEIWAARESWRKLLRADIPAQMAMDLMEYHERPLKALVICETKQGAFVERIAKDSKGGVSMVGGSIRLSAPEDLMRLEAEFREYLETNDIELPKTTLKLADVVKELTASGAKVSTADLILLRPFFSDGPEPEKTEPHLKVVEA